MKLLVFVKVLPAIIGVVLLSGCVKDSCKRTHRYTFFRPVYKTSEEVRNNIRSNAPRAIEHPGKIYVRGSYIFLNELDKGIHVIDNSNPSAPRAISFITIPGTVDLAVKGNTLYADLYSDLVAIDITNPQQVALNKVIDDVFPHRHWNGFVADANNIITEWIKVDTTITGDCNSNSRWQNPRTMLLMDAFAADGNTNNVSASPYGTGGSMARFCVINNYLYGVTQNELLSFNIAQPANPYLTNRTNLAAWGIETIYPFQNRLFIGSNNGMYVYNLTNAAKPSFESQYTHVRSCDPVIADGQFAYVTLRSGNACVGFTNQLEVLNIANFSQPSLLKVYPLTNPHGLAKQGQLLFICDGPDGVKVYNAADPLNLQLIKTISDIETYDVILQNNIALVVAKDGLYQYDYSNTNNIRQISKMGILR